MEWRTVFCRYRSNRHHARFDNADTDDPRHGDECGGVTKDGRTVQGPFLAARAGVHGPNLDLGRLAVPDRQGAHSLYSFSMTSRYFSLMTWRLIFCVGVSSSVSWVHSVFKRVKRMTREAWVTFLLYRPSS